MATEVDICNLALSRLGDTADVLAISPPEASPQAVYCARFYPVARDSLLERHAWGFATQHVTLSELVSNGARGWAHAYATPTNLVRAIDVLRQNDREPQDYALERSADGSVVLLTDVPDAVLRYTQRVTNTAQFSPLFIDALAWLLASYLAGPLLKGDAGAAMARQCLGAFGATMAAATASDSSQRRGDPEQTPAWIRGR